MQGYYNLTQKIKDTLLSDVNVNTVTTGDISRIALAKQTMFPLSHLIVNNATNEDSVLRFSLSIFAMDIVDVSKEEVVDVFVGNINEQDILNTQLAVLNRLVQILRGGSLHLDLYQVDSPPVFEPFYDRFEDELAGWVLTVDIIVPNDMSIC